MRNGIFTFTYTTNADTVVSGVITLNGKCIERIAVYKENGLVDKELTVEVHTYVHATSTPGPRIMLGDKIG